MSADNGIFVFRHLNSFAVVHHTLSGMPHDIPQIIANGKTCYNDPLILVETYQLAMAQAMKMRRAMIINEEILEYGVVDWTDYDYETDLKATDDYLARNP